MEAQPTMEAMTDLVISERRFLTKSRKAAFVQCPTASRSESSFIGPLAS